MRNFLTVATPATSRALLTLDELRAAAGVSDGSQDAALQAMGLRIADSIASECNVAAGVGAIPTLLRKSLVETFYGVACTDLMLSRRHDVTIGSIVIDGEALSGFVVDPESAIVTRLTDDAPVNWCATKVVVTYAAGFAQVPGDLKQAAMDFFRTSWLAKQRDPMARSVETDIPGLMREKTDFWVGALPGQSNEGAVPELVAGQLKRYRNYVIG